MAINLATKYSKKIAEAFTASSYLTGKTSNEYEFEGVKNLTIYTPLTQDLGDYSRTGANRYGTPTEVQDTIQTLTMTQDKSCSLVIDKGNNNEQMMVKNAGRMLKLQNDEKIVPFVDKYALGVYINKAGKIGTIASAPTKTTIVDAIADGAQALDDKSVPNEDRYLYITGAAYKVLRLSADFLGIDTLGEKALTKGVVGEVFGMKVVKVPTSYLPTNVYFVIAYKGSVLLPYKIQEAIIHENPQGISGALLEFRNNFDAFVLGVKCDGVYACVLASAKVGDLTITPTGASHAITCATSGATITYTTDGTDPRYSQTAKTYSTAVTLESGQTIKAYATKASMFATDVFEASYSA